MVEPRTEAGRALLAAYESPEYRLWVDALEHFPDRILAIEEEARHLPGPGEAALRRLVSVEGTDG